MTEQLTKSFRFVSVPIFMLGLLLNLVPQSVFAWTSARLANVDVTVHVAKDGTAQVVTQARFVVAGGRFHGFDLAELPGGEINREESRAALDDGRIYYLKFRTLRDGRTRVVLANKTEVEKGGVNFAIVHKVDLKQQGALRWYEGMARLNWTPLMWDEGLDVMKVQVHLPGKSVAVPITVDRAVSRDYEVAVKSDSVELTKFRPVRWYPMQVVIDFDPGIIPSLSSPVEDETPDMHPALSAGVAPKGPDQKPPLKVAVLPAAMVLLGLLALLLKRFHVSRVCALLSVPASYCFLPRTSFALRFFLSACALCLGLWAQYIGSLAAGVPALAVVAALWLTRREQSTFRQRSGGTWRKMDQEDVAMYRRMTRIYHRSRLNMVDITTPHGVVSFLAILFCIGYVALMVRTSWPRIGWAVVINGLLLAVPAWFSNVRAELPVDPTLEGFRILRRWRRTLSKMVGASQPGAQAEFWMREDDQGPIEIRLRVEPPPKGLNGIEVGGEVLRSGSVYRTRPVVILRTEPGTETARQLAMCKHAAEHHLTPDLEEEIIVLRNRRGRTLGLAPLRAALARIS